MDRIQHSDNHDSDPARHRSGATLDFVLAFEGADRAQDPLGELASEALRKGPGALFGEHALPEGRSKSKGPNVVHAILLQAAGWWTPRACRRSV